MIFANARLTIVTFLVKVRLENSINKRNFIVFCRFLVCSYAGCCYPTAAQIFQNKTSFFSGCHNFSHTRTNEKRSFVLKNLTSNRIRASHIATYEKSAKYCKVSFIYGVFKPYFDKKSCMKQVSKIILVYVCVVFKPGFFLLLTNYGFISRVYFTKFIANLRKLTIYVTANELCVRKFQFLLQF